MLKKIYINNYRCFQNFTINFDEQHTALCLGGNGSGKSTLFKVVEIFQKIGRGEAQLKELIQKQDFSFNNTNLPISLEIQVQINGQDYQYKLELDWPDHFRQVKVKQETLMLDGRVLLDRDEGKTKLSQYGTKIAEFTLDWHHIGLPLISSMNDQEPIAVLRNWLANILVLAPIPTQIARLSKRDERYLDKQAEHYLEWVRYLLAESPASYQKIVEFIQQRIPEFELFKFDTTGKDEKELLVRFKGEGSITLELNFDQLSDGEKIYFLTAAVLAAIDDETPRLCLWDEPDHYIALQELNQFITACRKAFINSNNGSQLIIASHSARVINNFSEHNTYFLSRKTHLHPARVELVKDKSYLSPTLVEAYENGEFADGSE